MGRSFLQKCRLINSAAKLFLASSIFLPLAVKAAGTGGMSGNYLEMPVGAAATALGGAYSASPDYFAAWWNPAAVATLHDSRAAAGTALRSFDRSDAYASLDFRVPPRVGVGLFMLYRGDNNISLHDEQENLLPTAKYTTITFKGAVSYYATRKLSLGATFNVFYQSLPAMEDGLGGISYSTVTSTGSFDFSAVYRVIPEKWTLAAVLKNVGAKNNWSVGADNSTGIDLTYSNLPTLTLGSSYLTALGGKPLLWNLDCRTWLFGDSSGSTNQGGVDISTGAEWRRWDNFYIRAGVGELPVNSDLLHNGELYKLEFSPRISAGFAYNLSKYVHKKMWVNYAASTDRVWAGLDHNLDITVAF